MAPKNLATILHGKPNRITQSLIYAALEWTLIFFLLLHSLFSYIIIKFALYFRLKPPCFLCSTIHSLDLSKSGYCFIHRRLFESQDMCFDCSSSQRSNGNELMCSCCGVTVRSKILHTQFVGKPNLGVLGETQMGNLVLADGYVGLRPDLKSSNGDQLMCSCCGVTIRSKILHSHFVGKPKLGVLGETQMGNLVLTDGYVGLGPDLKRVERNLDEDDGKRENGAIRDAYETDELVFEPDMAELHDGLVKGKQILESSSCLDVLKSDEVIQDLLNKEKMEMEVDEDKFKGSDVGKGLEAEKIAFLQGQEEETKREIYLEASIDEELCVSVINSDDHVKEMNELDVKLVRTDSETAVCHTERKPSASCIGERPTDLHKNGTYESKMTNNEPNEVEETSIDSFESLHKKLLLLGRREPANEEFGNEEVTLEELKLELKCERKAFCALYEELEEERNAAAVATSQTMAMISRLQEEKAAIEMEALQYQRMMEEQAEYDHKALQVVNETLAKREMEKEELEIELEMCRKQHFSVVLDNEVKENGHHCSSDGVLDMKDSLSCFEEERVSIVEQLKVLEENLIALAEEEENQIRNVDPFEEFYQENAQELILKLTGDANGELYQGKTMNGSKMKQFFYEDGGRMDPFLLDGLPLGEHGSEKRRFTLEEEVERLHERLEALEEDKEFVKHCFGSLRKGDRGLDLLREILEHFRELKKAEFRGRNGDGVC